MEIIHYQNILYTRFNTKYLDKNELMSLFRTYKLGIYDGELIMYNPVNKETLLVKFGKNEHLFVKKI